MRAIPSSPGGARPQGYRPPSPSTASGSSLVQHLITSQFLTQEQVAKLVKDLAAANGHGSVPLFAIRAGLLNEVALLKSLSKVHGMPAVDLLKVEPDEKVLRAVPADMALKYRLLPLRREGQKLTVAITDPWNHEATDTLRFATRYEIFPVLAGEVSMQTQLERYYPAPAKSSTEETVNSMLADITSEMSEVEVLETDADENNASLGVDEAPVVRLINAILIEAVQRGASDIHFECFEHELRVRYRVDGALQEVMKPPIKLRASLVSRFKIMSSLNIAERRVPQDGRIKLKFGGKVIDFRVSTLPTLFGEKIVLRILDKGNLTLDLEKFGIEPRAERELMEAVQNPYGMVLVTGPTGSGKTTTLYSCLSKINTGDTNIMTAEDPVEYNLFGINQVLVRNEIGMTFAAALKAFLRQDPNVIMVGEIRDLETGSIAIKAALTGHMVLSTLHTNSAPETITRLMDMGLEPFNVSSALNLILAQRLLRRICKGCREKYVPSDLEFAGAKVTATTTLRELRFSQEALDGAKRGASPDALPFLEGLTLDSQLGALPYFRGKGCDACNGTGYKGRQGLYEVMNMTPAIRKAVIQNLGAAELKDVAVSEGMLTLRMDGWLKVLRGITTLEQVVRETAA
ncbi:MAG: Flp pilus assembly complex ATPase component TadA [Gemmatimonadaceae bacterium]|nr:Flp pilus assembly complex ATPase component TadA [Gemmatimonadaceae bacterium]